MDTNKLTILVVGVSAAAMLTACSAQPAIPVSPPPSTSVPTTTKMTTVPTTPLAPTLTIKLMCTMGGSRQTFSISLSAEFPSVWTRMPRSCEATRTTAPLNELEQRAFAASGYQDPSDIKTLYGLCAEVDDTDTYVTEGFSPSPSQINEITGMLTLCPNHPHAAKLNEAIKRGQADADLEATGQLFSSGTYRVGDEIQPGTFAIEADIENCLWERTDRQGQIIDNNFVSGAKRVEVTIRSTDYSFHSEGCGTWRRSK